MAYLVINKRNLAAGAIGYVDQCTSAIFNYQVIGQDAVVEFSGSNVPIDILDKDNDAHWIPIVTISDNMMDSEPFRQHTWHSIRWKVVAGTQVGVFVSSGVSG